MAWQTARVAEITDDFMREQMTRTDTTAALQAAGGVGLAAHRPSTTTAVTDVRVTTFSARPVA